ncbi:photosystem II reaction center W protein, chloroplastic-like [Mangifera indica]|uniref:photosystem II reaction center W protein, chloroplastic-like n=1 Tax=Mangifera indica TaxID=29780 RepID=UPI001CFB67D5|nr:photosystem II reaction center W protein, chloroplastic-like [Mangifera indica]
MALISTSNLSALLPPATKAATTVRLSSLYGLPVEAMATKGRVKCTVEEKTPAAFNVAMSSKGSMATSLMAAAAAVSTAAAGPAMALVDERMSTEGTGLPFGLSNNILGWILLGVFGLIWSLYIVYAGDLEEDEDSGLSL